MAIETSATQQSRGPRHHPENNNPIGFYVIWSYVSFLSFKFFEFYHEFLIKFVKWYKIAVATYLENNKGLNNKVKRLYDEAVHYREGTTFLVE
jgi:hypothetical protein